MMEGLLSYLTSNPQAEAILKFAQIIASSVVAITIVYTVKTYRRMRKTEQVRFAHDFFKEYLELQRESAKLYEEGKEIEEREHWASAYFNTLEWGSLLINSKEIKNKRLVGFYKDLIIDSVEKILPVYHSGEEIKEKNLYSELHELYQKLKNHNNNFFTRLIAKRLRSKQH